MDTAAEICIICLGELPTEDPIVPANQDPTTVEDEDVVVLPSRKQRQKSPVKNEELIANLRPCDHYLHDDCVRQWVDKANSCPICRAAFNVVEVSRYLQGPIINSYAVQDKLQVQEFDTAALAGVDEEPCVVCGSTTGEDSTFLICDGCDEYCHVHCAGLDTVPDGSFICPACQQEGLTQDELDRLHGNAIATSSHLPNGRSTTSQRQRPQGGSLSQRSAANRQRRETAQWASVWQAVLDRTNLDLEFPFLDSRSRPRSGQERREAEQAAEDAWLLRWQIAEQQGAGFVFEETSRRRLAPRHHQVESEEEAQSWRAFERARAGITDPESAKKRKRRTPTPQSEDTQPQRRFKKPRTRIADSEPKAGEGSSNRARRQADSTRPSDTAAVGPTFLQSLLTHIDAGPQSASSPSEYFSDAHIHRHGSASHASSPGSPYVSNPVTPRSLSPPPISPRSRLSSPLQLPPQTPPTFSPSVSQLSPSSDTDSAQRHPRQHRTATSPTDRPRRPRQDSSGTILSLEHKTEIQKMVSDALKPFYRKRDIDKDEYTEINRDISRILYDKVAFDGGLKDDASRERWRTNAAQEVEKAVDATIAAKTRTHTPTTGTSTPRRVPQVISSA